MLSTIRKEVIDIGQQVKTHREPISIICFSIALIAIFKERKPIVPMFHLDGIGDYYLNRMIYWGIVPMIFGTLITRKSPLKLGLGIGDYRYWLPVTLTFLLIAIPIVYFFSASPDFQSYYAQKNFDLPQYLINVTVLMLGWEYFFRGFMTMTLKPTIKETTILIQMIPFTLLHLGKPVVETLACIPSGLFWGYVCYRAESFWPALIMHLAINIVLKCGSVGYL